MGLHDGSSYGPPCDDGVFFNDGANYYDDEDFYSSDDDDSLQLIGTQFIFLESVDAKKQYEEELLRATTTAGQQQQQEEEAESEIVERKRLKKMKLQERRAKRRQWIQSVSASFKSKASSRRPRISHRRKTLDDDDCSSNNNDKREALSSRASDLDHHHRYQVEANDDIVEIIHQSLDGEDYCDTVEKAHEKKEEFPPIHTLTFASHEESTAMSTTFDYHRLAVRQHSKVEDDVEEDLHQVDDQDEDPSPPSLAQKLLMKQLLRGGDYNNKENVEDADGPTDATITSSSIVKDGTNKKKTKMIHRPRISTNSTLLQKLSLRNSRRRSKLSQSSTSGSAAGASWLSSSSLPTSLLLLRFKGRRSHHETTNNNVPEKASQ